MDEKEVLKRIAIDNKAQLYGILKENDCKYQVYKYNGKFFPLEFIKKQILKQNISGTIRDNRVLQIKLFGEKSCGWQAILSSKDPVTITYDVEWNREKLPHIKNLNYDLKKYSLNKGHLLAKNFFDKKIIKSRKYKRSNNGTWSSFDSKKI